MDGTRYDNYVGATSFTVKLKLKLANPLPPLTPVTVYVVCGETEFGVPVITPLESLEVIPLGSDGETLNDIAPAYGIHGYSQRISGHASARICTSNCKCYQWKHRIRGASQAASGGAEAKTAG